MPPSLYDRLRRAAALSGPLPLVVRHDHVGIRVGHAGRLRPTAAGLTAAADRRRLRHRPAASPRPPRRRCRRTPHTASGPAPGAAVLVPVRPASRCRRPRRPTRARRSRPRRRPAGRRSRRPRPRTLRAPPAPCRRRRRGSARRSRLGWITLPPWGILILQGAARSWMIFAIVWGSIVFVGENELPGPRPPPQHDQRPDHHRRPGLVRTEPRGVRPPLRPLSTIAGP